MGFVFTIVTYRSWGCEKGIRQYSTAIGVYAFPKPDTYISPMPALAFSSLSASPHLQSNFQSQVLDQELRNRNRKFRFIKALSKAILDLAHSYLLKNDHKE